MGGYGRQTLVPGGYGETQGLREQFHENENLLGLNSERPIEHFRQPHDNFFNGKFFGQGAQLGDICSGAAARQCFQTLSGETQIIAEGKSQGFVSYINSQDASHDILQTSKIYKDLACRHTSSGTSPCQARPLG